MIDLTDKQTAALIDLVRREREDAIEDPYFAEEVAMWTEVLDALERQRSVGDDER